MTQPSTIPPERTVTEDFSENPVGFTVQLGNGDVVEVGGYRDTPKGRWLRIRRRGGPWIPEGDVESVITYSLSLPGWVR